MNPTFPFLLANHPRAKDPIITTKNPIASLLPTKIAPDTPNINPTISKIRLSINEPPVCKVPE